MAERTFSASISSIGFWFSIGVWQCLGVAWAITIILALLLTPISNRLRDTDATDAAQDKRSGFSLMTDYGTGCQYLKTGSGLTPRLDATGHQICKPR